MFCDPLREEHRRLVTSMDRLIALISKDRMPSPPVLTAMRWALVTQVDRHIANEELMVRIPLDRSDDPLDVAIGRSYADGLLDLRLAAAAHQGKWNMANIQRDLAGYRASVIATCDELKARQQWEEEEVFPFAEALHTRRAAGGRPLATLARA